MCFNKYKNDQVISCGKLFGPYDIQPKKKKTKNPPQNLEFL